MGSDFGLPSSLLGVGTADPAGNIVSDTDSKQEINNWLSLPVVDVFTHDSLSIVCTPASYEVFPAGTGGRHKTPAADRLSKKFI